MRLKGSGSMMEPKADFSFAALRKRGFLSLFSLVLSTLAWTGCLPAIIPIDKAEMARLKSEPQIHVVTYQPPRFTYQMASGPVGSGAAGVFNPATGGLGVGMAGGPRGQVFMLAPSLEDPVVQVKGIFVRGLVDRLDVSRLTQVQEALAEDDIRALDQRFGGAVVLDFKTESWGLVPGLLRTLPYQIFYVARSRLLRVSEGRVLWQGYCQYDGSDLRANLDEFTANPPAGLGEKFKEAAETCGKTLLSQFFDQRK